MHTRDIELQLFEEVWRHRVAALTVELERTRSSRSDDPELTGEAYKLRSALHARLALYKLCVDWVMGERESSAGRWNQERASARERFYHLMAVLAKMETACEEGGPTIDLMSAANHAPAPLPEARVEELLVATSSVLDTLSRPHVGHA